MNSAAADYLRRLADWLDAMPQPAAPEQARYPRAVAPPPLRQDASQRPAPAQQPPAAAERGSGEAERVSIGLPVVLVKFSDRVAMQWRLLGSEDGRARLLSMDGRSTVTVSADLIVGGLPQQPALAAGETVVPLDQLRGGLES